MNREPLYDKGCMRQCEWLREYYALKGPQPTLANTDERSRAAHICDDSQSLMIFEIYDVLILISELKCMSWGVVL